jgi:hypothetical protein
MMEMVENTELGGNFSSLQVSSDSSSNRIDALNSIADASVLPSAVDGFDSDEIESSQAPAMEKRNAGTNEHEQREKHDLLSGAVPQPKTIQIQQIGGSQNGKDFKVSSVLGGNLSVVSDSIVAADSTPNVRSTNISLESANLSRLIEASRVLNGDSSEVSNSILEAGFGTDTPSTNLSLAEANLSALSTAIDECFSDRSGLDITASQLLAMLTYLHGLPSQTEDPSDTNSGYHDMSWISTLAKSYIETHQTSKAVSLYRHVIVRSRRVLKTSEYPDFTRAMEESTSFSKLVKQGDYLDHEAVVLQIVVAGYFNHVLYGLSSLSAPDDILGVIDRLRVFHTTKTSSLGKALVQRLESLAQIIQHYWQHPPALEDQFRDELRFHALCLAICYSIQWDFEVAEIFFRFRHYSSPPRPMTLSLQTIYPCPYPLNNGRRWSASEAL